MAEEIKEADEPKNSSKLLMIIIVILVLIIIGGGVAFFLLTGEKSEDTEAPAETAETAEKTMQNKVYYELEQPLRVNFPKGSSARLIEIKLALLLSTKDAEEELQKHQPMIVNNLLMSISAVGANKLAFTEGKNELRAKILEEIQHVMTEMTGKNPVEEIFYTSFVMQ